MRKLVLISAMDPQHSVDLFDADRTNEFGERFCVAPAILPREVDEYWNRYQREDEKGTVLNEKECT